MTKVPSPWIPETDPVRLKILGKLSEELGELSSAVARCTIQGIDENHPVTGKPNREWAMEEIADVTACVLLAVERLNLDHVAIQKRGQLKYDYLTAWVDM